MVLGRGIQKDYSMTDQLNLLPVAHMPIIKPRDGHLGERIFCEEWASLAGDLRFAFDEQESKLDRILSNLTPEATQRDAHVAASFVTWLGTSCGKAMLVIAERLRPVADEDAILFAWAQANMRRFFVNGGNRAIEAILAPEDHFGPSTLVIGCSELKQRPEMTLRDAEVVDHVALWLGTMEGWNFIDRCERRIKFEQSEEWRRQRESMAIDIPAFLRTGKD
jgi:hypothetical protein